jgi:hypothetical protein
MLKAYIPFSDEFDPDPEAAADELRRAGYKVFRLPTALHPIRGLPLDDHIECLIEGPDDSKILEAIVNEINAIVGPHGGMCIECGPVGADYVPFEELTAPRRRTA